jgi:hypothetical protein
MNSEMYIHILKADLLMLKPGWIGILLTDGAVYNGNLRFYNAKVLAAIGICKQEHVKQEMNKIYT